MYNLESDPNELNNIIKIASITTLNNFIEYLYKERKELFTKKGIYKKVKVDNSVVKIIPDHMEN